MKYLRVNQTFMSNNSMNKSQIIYLNMSSATFGQTWDSREMIVTPRCHPRKVRQFRQGLPRSSVKTNLVTDDESVNQTFQHHILFHIIFKCILYSGGGFNPLETYSSKMEIFPNHERKQSQTTSLYTHVHTIVYIVQECYPQKAANYTQSSHTVKPNAPQNYHPGEYPLSVTRGNPMVLFGLLVRAIALAFSIHQLHQGRCHTCNFGLAG